MKFVKYMVLNEVAMSIGELFKDRTPNRIDVLLHKIKSGSPFTIIGGREVTLDPQANAELMATLASKDKDAITAALKAKGRELPVFVDTEGGTWTIGQLEKTSDFGGGGGANAGSAQTALQEVGQAVVLGLVSELGSDITEDDLTMENLQIGAKHVQPDPSGQLDQILQLCTTSRDWATTLVSCAKVLYDTLDLDGKTFHRGSDWVTKLSNEFVTNNKKMSPKPFSNVNKWTPADIWAVDSGVEPPKVESLEDLNRWVLDHFNEGSVYGISLKKTSANPKVSIYNQDPMADKVKAVMKDLIVSRGNKLGDLFRSKGTRAVYSTESTNIPLLAYYKLLEGQEGEVQNRSFGSGNISSEIQGKHAAHGKIGFGGLNKILRELTGQPLTPWKVIQSMVTKDKRAVIEEIITMAEETIKSYLKPDEKKEVFSAANNSTGEALVSKYQSVQMLYLLTKARSTDSKVADKFITQILQAAGSQSPMSAVFVKVS